METNDVSLTNVTQNSSLVSRIMGNARIKLARWLAGELSLWELLFFFKKYGLAGLGGILGD